MTSSNKKVIIVGASSGIGRALAELYAGSGHSVAITGRRTELLEEVKKSYPRNITTKCFDVMGNQNIEHLQLLIQELGGLEMRQPTLEIVVRAVSDGAEEYVRHVLPDNRSRL